MAFLIIAPTKTITENIVIPYTDQETYYIKEQVQTQEAYQEQEAYQATESYLDTVSSYTKINAPLGSHFETDLDDLTADGCDCSEWALIEKHNPQQVCVQKKCSKSIDQTRTVTKYRPVTKYRTVTKYQDVPHFRDVAKTRIEPRQVEVNWILGFKTPWKIHI
jgi:hypothetical protein